MLTEDTMLENQYDKMANVIAEFRRNLYTQLETAIIYRLKKCGFEFKSQEELHEFAKKRLTIRYHSDDPLKKELYMDGTTLIAWWDEEVEIHKEGATITVTMNKHKK